jgi:hypothetical protein
MPQGQLTTYSGLAMVGSITFPLSGPIVISGIAQQGIQTLNIRMHTPHANLKVAMDGAQVPSWVPGEGGTVEVQIYQQSTLHQALVTAYNAMHTAAMLGDVSGTFTGQFYLRDTSTGNTHTATGVSIEKVPDKPYQDQSQVVTWTLICCNVISETGSALGAFVGALGALGI